MNANQPTGARAVWLRAGLIALGVSYVFPGIWARVAPHSFYKDFPGFGRHWVEAIPPYNAHLITDVGGGLLALGILVIAAAVVLERRVVIVALLAWTVFALSHFIYHAGATGHYSTADNVANLVSLGFAFLLPFGLLLLLSPRRERAPRAAAPRADGTRISGVPEDSRNPVVRASYRESKKQLGWVTKPIAVHAHAPGLLAGYGAFELATMKATRVDHRLKELAQLKAAMLVGCEYCVDIGSMLSQSNGATEAQLRALPSHRESDEFSELEKLVLDYAVGMSRTPVDVPDELYAALREHLSEPELVELTSVIALENYRGRFNWALGIGAEGFSEGAYCVRPEPAATTA